MAAVQHLHVGWTVLLLVLCIAPLTFYVHIFRPCWDCSDFESTAVHEIGHLLGLSHPDEYPLARKVATEQMGPLTCRDPEVYLRNESLIAEAERSAFLPRSSDYSSSVMQAFTQHPTEVCLTADDLLGLNYLYPVCTHALPPPASCYKSERNIGWLRFALWVVLPVLVALLLLLGFVGIVKRHQVRKLGTFAIEMDKLKKHNLKLLRRMEWQEAKMERQRLRRAGRHQGLRGSAASTDVGYSTRSGASSMRSTRLSLEAEMAHCTENMLNFATELHQRKLSSGLAGGASSSRRGTHEDIKPIGTPRGGVTLAGVEEERASDLT